MGFNPWIRKIPWRRKRQPTLVFLPGKFHRQSSLAGYSPWVAKSLIQLGNRAHIRAFVIKFLQYGTKRFWGSNRIFKELLVWKLGKSGLFLVDLEECEVEGVLHEWKPGFFQCYEHSHGYLLITYMSELQIKMGLYVFHHSRVNLVY